MARVCLSLIIIMMVHAIIYYFGDFLPIDHKMLAQESVPPSKPTEEPVHPPTEKPLENASNDDEDVAAELREYLRELRTQEQESKGKRS